MATTLETIHTTKTVYHFTEDLGVPLTLPLQMIQIPRGTFIMGASTREEGSSKDEQPEHQVTLNSFFMARYPVTQEQWKAIAEQEELRVSIELEPDPSDFKDDYQEGEQQITRWKRPVENVSWQEAMEYCARLSKLTGKTYSLPSEAQWEYACRAGTVTPFHFGETITTELANYDGIGDEEEGWKGNYGQGPKGIYRQQTTPVDYFNAPNAFGLSDMHGNVWEWCLDPWHPNYEDAPSNGQVWDQGKEDLYDNIQKNLDVLLEENRTRVFRGGSWFGYPRYCRSAFRYNNDRDVRLYNFGFRVMCDAERT
ncbi:formylglycine-generating enzyme family protein [Crocosphaera chwakensis]|uniref:Sulfatase-modifying factor enzyme-like domain-containing protein n=1 Tax=Crocosphaera chwakensis CCY0110 TaxID=391612 RepID=A3IVX9_9CHRO|nr:formylglycine-generating enzyme family protein [Crocosphaera chwakensis]EAZ89365.1 hypothetical protein CY0110_30830 [Crocosphaera chwakensis CCY0110]